MKKNISIELAKQFTNELLKSDISLMEKSGVCMLLEKMLRENNAYKGYYYFDQSEDIDTSLKLEYVEVSGKFGLVQQFTYGKNYFDRVYL